MEPCWSNIMHERRLVDKSNRGQTEENYRTCDQRVFRCSKKKDSLMLTLPPLQYMDFLSDMRSVPANDESLADILISRRFHPTF